MGNSLRVLSENRKAKHDYFIEDEYCAGLILQGCEVKSIMNGDCSIAESHIDLDSKCEAYLLNSHVDRYSCSVLDILSKPYDPKRKRKLLLNRSELNKLQKKVKEKGYTIVPLKLVYSNRKIKLILGLAKGKKKYDKRNELKDRQMKRDMDRKNR